jgi:thymidylate kinase
MNHREAPLFCLTGIDGCGKSTQVRRLTRRLRAAGRPAVAVWTGGQKTFTGPLVRLGQRRLRAPRRGEDRRFVARRGGSREVAAEYTQYLSSSHRLFRRQRLLRRCWTDLSLIEHMLEIDWTVLPHLRKGRTVVCDRYLYRTVVNLAVLLDIPPSDLPRLLRHPTLRLVPRPTLYFLLDVPAEVAYQRKIDLPSIEYLERRVPLYRTLATLTGMPVIDACQDPDMIENQIWTHVEQALLNQSMGRPERMNLSTHRRMEQSERGRHRDAALVPWR